MLMLNYNMKWRNSNMPRGRKPKSDAMPKMKEIKDNRKAQKIVYEYALRYAIDTVGSNTKNVFIVRN